ncbi:MAG: TldD/PmbA family protein [Nitrospinae bacterium]|nr:TldD/PmbA family protein [Nitrospinota bacterium]
MLEQSVIKKVLKETLSNGGEMAELFIEDSASASIVCEDNKIEQVISGRDLGAGLRLIYDKRTAYAYTNNIDEKSLIALAKSVRSAAGGNGDVVFDMSVKKPQIDFPILKPINEIAAGKKIEKVKAANEAARGFDKRIRQVKVMYQDGTRNVVVANSKGEQTGDERTGIVFLVHVVASDGMTIQTGYESAGGFMGFELFDNETPEKIAKTAASRAIMMLEAEKAPAGEMAVVLSSDAGGTMIHEAIGHGLEGDFIQQGLSVYSKRLGEKIASQLITVVDDGTLPNKRGSFRFDDEGTASQRTVLVEEGVLKQFMYDRLSAMKEGRSSTGNGRRMSYKYRPIPRMTNTLIAPGKMNPAEIVESVKKGLFVKKMGGGEVNIVNGDFVFEVSEGYLIEDGKVRQPVRGATLTGNGPEVLKGIDMVGNDLGFSIGTCGKDGQGAPVSDAQPTLRIPKIIVGGTKT